MTKPAADRKIRFSAPIKSVTIKTVGKDCLSLRVELTNGQVTMVADYSPVELLFLPSDETSVAEDD